jgi:hypothetical protein
MSRRVKGEMAVLESLAKSKNAKMPEKSTSWRSTRLHLGFDFPPYAAKIGDV